MRKILKNLLALVMVFVMVLGMIPAMAFLLDENIPAAAAAEPEPQSESQPDVYDSLKMVHRYS